MRRPQAVLLALGLALAAGCGREAPTLTPDELAAGWEKHKGETVVLAGTPKIVIAEKRMAFFYSGDGGHRISAEVANGSESPPPGQPCKLRGTVKGIEGKTIVLTGCRPLP